MSLYLILSYSCAVVKIFVSPMRTSQKGRQPLRCLLKQGTGLMVSALITKGLEWGRLGFSDTMLHTYPMYLHVDKESQNHRVFSQRPVLPLDYTCIISIVFWWYKPVQGCNRKVTQFWMCSQINLRTLCSVQDEITAAISINSQSTCTKTLTHEKILALP